MFLIHKGVYLLTKYLSNPVSNHITDTTLFASFRSDTRRHLYIRVYIHMCMHRVNPILVTLFMY